MHSNKMKRIILQNLSILILTFISFATHAQTNSFDKFSNFKDITYVYLSESMLKLIGTDAIPNINGVDIKEIGSKLKSIQIISSNEARIGLSETKKNRELLKTETQKIIKKSIYEKLMQITENDSHVEIYHKKEKEISTLVMIYDDQNDDYMIVVFSGTFNISNVMQAFKARK